MFPISIIVPVFNGERRLPKLLRSLRSQTYDQSALEIIIVDDDSTDKSVEIAASFGARVVRNGEKNPERGKSIGIDASSHELLLFIDDDNYLPHERWLEQLVKSYCSVPNATGAQCARFFYDSTDTIANRYCCLFGGLDPLVFYLGRQDHLRYIDTDWSLNGTVLSSSDTHWVVRFTADEMPTLGSQGFLTRRSVVDRISWTPYFFHIDANYELARQAPTDYVFMKDSVGHDFADSSKSMVGKIARNIRQFTRDTQIRNYKYETNLFKVAGTFFRMLSLVEPLYSSYKTYVRTRDRASWLHVRFTFYVAALYLWLTPLNLLQASRLRAATKRVEAE